MTYREIIKFVFVIAPYGIIKIVLLTAYTNRLVRIVWHRGLTWFNVSTLVEAGYR